MRLFKCKGGDNAHWISKNKMAATAVQWKLCGTNFRENIANLWVSCHNGNNDRSARVLFVQHPREQGEWLRQNPRYARVLTASFDLLPRVQDEQHPSRPVIIPPNNSFDHSDVLEASPIGAAPTTSSFSTWHLVSMDLGKDNCNSRRETIKFWDLVHLILQVWQYSPFCCHLMKLKRPSCCYQVVCV